MTSVTSGPIPSPGIRVTWWLISSSPMGLSCAAWSTLHDHNNAWRRGRRSSLRGPLPLFGSQLPPPALSLFNCCAFARDIRFPRVVGERDLVPGKMRIVEEVGAVDDGAIELRISEAEP